MEDIPNIEIRQAIVTPNSKAWNVVGTISSNTPRIKIVTGIRACFRPRICGQKIQAACKSLLKRDLKAVVGTVSLSCYVTGTSREIFEWFEVVRVRGYG